MGEWVFFIIGVLLIILALYRDKGSRNEDPIVVHIHNHISDTEKSDSSNTHKLNIESKQKKRISEIPIDEFSKKKSSDESS